MREITKKTTATATAYAHSAPVYLMNADRAPGGRQPPDVNWQLPSTSPLLLLLNP